MAQLRDSVVQGSLRVTDTTYTTDLIVSGSKTARYALIAPTSDGAPSWRALTNADVGLSNVENTKLSTWVGTSNITTLGTIATGTWNATTIAVNKGGTNITSYTIGDILYASAATTLSKLAGNTTTTRKFLRSVATTSGTAVAPAWDTVTNTDVGLGNVTNDAQVKASLGTTKGDMLYWSAANTPARLGIGNANHILIASANGPVWTVSAILSSATTTTANTDAWDILTLGNNVNRTSTSAHSSGRIVLYSTATAATTIQHGSWTGSGLTVGGTVTGQSNAAFVVSGQSDPDPYIRFDTRAGTSSLGSTKTVTYTTTATSGWAYIYCQIPTRKNTYAVAGDVNSTVTYNYTSYPTRFFFRQYSYTAAAAARDGNYEDYRLPAVNADRGSNATYEIITTKNLSDITSVKGATFAGSAAASYIATFSGTTDATSSTGAVIINGGLLVKKKLYVTTAATFASTLGVSGATTLSSTLGVTGATTLSNTLTVTGAATLNGNIISGTINYGTALPATDLTPGRLFFQTSESEYELPVGGDAGSMLVKASVAERDVIWSNTIYNLTVTTNITAYGNITGAKVYNAVWNDYAECRSSWVEEPGRVIVESKNGTMELATERLMAGCKIISDTYGNLMGQSKTARTPIAVAGRVLAYPYQAREKYELGAAVCSAPNGTIDIMTREEIREYPERILGTVSEIPDYDVWYAGNEQNPTPIQVNGRIWIYVR